MAAVLQLFHCKDCKHILINLCTGALAPFQKPTHCLTLHYHKSKMLPLTAHLPLLNAEYWVTSLIEWWHHHVCTAVTTPSQCQQVRYAAGTKPNKPVTKIGLGQKTVPLVITSPGWCSPSTCKQNVQRRFERDGGVDEGHGWYQRSWRSVWSAALTFNHHVDNSRRGATFRVTDGTSLFANGILTLRGSFQQKKIFNASGNITIKGPRGLPSAQQDYFRLSKLPPLAPQDHFGKARPLLTTKCGSGGPVLAWTTFYMTKLLPHYL